MFVLKIVEAGIKSKTVQSGYILRVANQTENAFELVDKIDVAREQKETVYYFTKIN